MKYFSNLKKNPTTSVFRLAIALSCLAVVSSCNKPNNKAGTVHATELKTQTVEIVQPNRRSFIGEIQITGNARPNKIVLVHAMEEGYLKTIRKDIGDEVRQNEIIAELHNPELMRNLQKMEALFEAKKAVYDRLKKIQEKTPALTSKQMVEDAKGEHLSAQAQLNSIKDRIQLLTVTAPFKGTVTKRYVDEGSVIQSGMSNANAGYLVEVQDLNPIRIMVALTEGDANLVQKGMEVDVSFPEMEGTNFKAKISRMAGALDPDSRTMHTEIDVSNADLKIKPGMYAKVVIKVKSRDKVLSLPTEAQVILGDEPFLLAVENNYVVQYPLRKGLTNKTHFEILNSEIKETSQIIIKGKNLVNAGQLVKPIKLAE